MSFDFLPNETPPPAKPNTEGEEGGKFSVGKSVFFDNYLHHLDAHALFSTPPIKSEFKRSHNFFIAEELFSQHQLERKIKSGFYGPKTDFDKLINGYTTFQDPGLLNSSIKSINNEIPEDLFSQIEKPKMKINDKFGIFSFDLAAMAMTYVYEYVKVSNNELVETNQVEKKGNKFIYIPTKEEVKQQIKRRNNGTPVVVSSVRNSLIDFDKQNKKDRSVEIFVLNSYRYKEEAKDIVYNSMAAISVAQNLLKKGFRVKLTSLLVGKEEGTTYFHFVPAKRFNQPLDINAAAYVCGDPRFFRYQGFKMLISGFDKHNKDAGNGIASIISDQNIIAKTIEKDYVLNSNLKQADTRLYFGGSRSLSEAKKETLKAIEILNEKYNEN